MRIARPSVKSDRDLCHFLWFRAKLSLSLFDASLWFFIFLYFSLFFCVYLRQSEPWAWIFGFPKIFSGAKKGSSNTLKSYKTDRFPGRGAQGPTAPRQGKPRARFADRCEGFEALGEAAGQIGQGVLHFWESQEEICRQARRICTIEIEKGLDLLTGAVNLPCSGVLERVYNFRLADRRDYFALFWYARESLQI